MHCAVCIENILLHVRIPARVNTARGHVLSAPLPKAAMPQHVSVTYFRA